MGTEPQRLSRAGSPRAPRGAPRGARRASSLPAPPAKNTQHGHSCRRCSGLGSPSRGTGPILPFVRGLCTPAAGSLACRGQALTQPRRLCCPREPAATQRGSSPGGYSQLRAAIVSLCVLLMPTMAGSACTARLPGCRCCRADPAVRTHRLSRPWHWGDAQAGGLQTSGQEPL